MVWTTPDVCGVVFSFLDARSAMRARMACRTAETCFVRLCWAGLASPALGDSRAHAPGSARSLRPLITHGCPDGPMTWMRLFDPPPNNTAPHWFGLFAAVGSAGALARFAEPPWNLAGCAGLLQVAAATGNVAVVRALGDPHGPWRLGPEAARHQVREYGPAIVVARDFVTDTMRNCGCRPLNAACRFGHAAVLAELGDPNGPWRLGPDDARDTGTSGTESVLCDATWDGHVDVITMLGDPNGPWRLGHADARAFDSLALWTAARRGHAAVVRILGDPNGPWRLGPTDARAVNNENDALREACEHGHADVLHLLGDPDGPWQLGPDDARAVRNGALRFAAANGHANVVAALGDPGGPWRLGPEDARTDNCFALRMASEHGHADVVRLLCDPDGPWRLTESAD